MSGPALSTSPITASRKDEVFQRLGRHPLGTEKSVGDLAISRAIGPAVGGSHHQSDTSTLVRRDASVAGNGARVRRVPEPQHCLDPIGQIVIEWQDDSRGFIGFSARQQEDLRDDTAAMDGMETFRTRANGSRRGQ